jgi:GAF domain-containing protein
MKAMKGNEAAYREIVSAVRDYAARAADPTALQQFTVERIAARLHYYNWAGFYMIDPRDPGMLQLGPYVGAPTEHVRIPLSEGICGAAAAEDASIIVDDVQADPRYLACSLETRSEIVVPIRAAGRVVGEIDIDSHTPAAFGAEDRVFLEECAAIIGAFIAAHAG